MPKPPRSINELLSPSRLRSRWSAESAEPAEPAANEAAAAQAAPSEAAPPDGLSVLAADIAEDVRVRCNEPRGEAIRAFAAELAELLADATTKEDLSPGKRAEVAQLLRGIEDLLEVEELVARGRSR